MAQSSGADPTAARLDVRLVPAAVTSWVVTAAGIVWPVGDIVGTLCAAGAVSGALLWRVGCPRSRMRALGVALAAARADDDAERMTRSMVAQSFSRVPAISRW